MVMHHNAVQQSTESGTLADILERVLDKGVVIAGDIVIKLCDIELLTIRIRLLIASVDKAKEMGIDWWTSNSFLNPPRIDGAMLAPRMDAPVREAPAALPVGTQNAALLKAYEWPMIPKRSSSSSITGKRPRH